MTDATKPAKTGETEHAAAQRGSAAKDQEAIMAAALTRAGQCIEQGVAPADIMEWSEEKLEALYALGRNYYMRGDYAAAEQVMAWLARVNGRDVKILKALAAARKMQGKHQGAVDVYSLAAVLDLEDPEPSLFAAECLFHMGEKDRTRSALAAARQQAEALPGSDDLIAHIDAMADLVDGAAA